MPQPPTPRWLGRRAPERTTLRAVRVPATTWSFADHAADLAYEASFDHCGDGEVESNLYRPVGDGCRGR